MSNELKLDLEKIRQRAREHMKEGAVTAANTADLKQLINVLNDALATEIVCVLRYKSHAFAAKGPRGAVVRQEMLEHAAEEQAHADQLADRIDALGGVPELNPAGIGPRSHTEYKSTDSLKQNLVEDLVAERIAIQTYTEIVRWLGDRDPTTRRVFEDILAKEEEHADDVARLLSHLE
jgi:bacterioferritin